MESVPSPALRRGLPCREAGLEPFDRARRAETEWGVVDGGKKLSLIPKYLSKA